MSASRLKRNSSIREVDADVTTEELDVSNAARQLHAAETAAQASDWAAADAALGGIAVIRVHNRGVMPLLKARDNLMLALAEINGGQYGNAAAPLRSAAEALGEFARSGSAPEASQAERLQADINAYAQSVSKDHDDARDRLTAWVQRVEQWHRARLELR